MGPIDLLVLQPTPFCNIICKYCYLPHKNLTKKILPETVHQVCLKVVEDKLIGQNITLVWHAGEPMVIQPDYFRILLETVRGSLSESKVQVRHSIQTNGTLISQDWCDLINEFNINIGISIDGPEFLNDTNRVDRKGKGTFKRTMKGIEMLKSNNIPYHGIAVLSLQSLGYPLEIFNFFKENGFYHLGLNIEEIEGLNTKSTLQEESAEKQIRNFYRKLISIYTESDGKMEIRELKNAISGILRRPDVDKIEDFKIFSHQTEPYGILAVDCDGNFSTFSPELLSQNSKKYENFIFGNISTSSFKEALQKPNFKQIYEEIRDGISKCSKTYDYFSVCGGGAPANKLYENGAFNTTETLYCKYSIQIPTDSMLDYLEDKLNI